MTTLTAPTSTAATAAPPPDPADESIASGDVGVIGFAHAGLRMTPAEFDAIKDYDEDYRYELIHGVLVVTPIAGEYEADPNEQLGHWLRTYQESHPQGAALDLTLPERYIHLPDSRRRADRVIWAGLGRRPSPLTDVPTIAVEFVSQGRRSAKRDYEEKRDEYLALGVQEYWVIDRFRQAMTVYQNQVGQPKEHTITRKQTYQTPILPGFKLPLSSLLNYADRWT